MTAADMGERVRKVDGLRLDLEQGRDLLAIFRNAYLDLTRTGYDGMTVLAVMIAAGAEIGAIRDGSQVWINTLRRLADELERRQDNSPIGRC